MSSTARKQGLGGLLSSPIEEGEEHAPAQTSLPTPPATPRSDRRRKPPRDKLTVNVPVGLKRALEDLAYRDDTHIQDEVTEALTQHLTSRGVTIPKD